MNKEIVWNIFDGIIIAATSGLILREYFRLFFKGITGYGWIRVLTWLAYLCWQFFILKLSIPWYGKLGINIAFIVIVGITNYLGKLGKKVIFAISFCALWVLTEFLLGYIFILLDIHIVEYNLLGSIISKLLLMLFVIIIKRMYINDENITLSPKYTLILGGIALGSIFIVSDLFYLSEKNIESNEVHMEIFCSVILISINILIFRIYSDLTDYIRLQRINEAHERQLHSYDYYIKNKETEFENNRKIRHDLKQYCIYLLKILEDKNYEQGIEFFL